MRNAIRIPLVFSLFLFILIAPNISLAAFPSNADYSNIVIRSYDLSILADSDTQLIHTLQYSNNTNANTSYFWVMHKSITNSSYWLSQWALSTNLSTIRISPFFIGISGETINEAATESCGGAHNHNYQSDLQKGFGWDGLNITILAKDLGGGGGGCSDGAYGVKMMYLEFNYTLNTFAMKSFGAMQRWLISDIPSNYYSIADDGGNYFYVINQNDTHTSPINGITETETANLNNVVSIWRINSAFTSIVTSLHPVIPLIGDPFYYTIYPAQATKLPYSGMNTGFWHGAINSPTRLKSQENDANNPRLFALVNRLQTDGFSISGFSINQTCSSVNGVYNNFVSSTCPVYQAITAFNSGSETFDAPTQVPLTYHLGMLASVDSLTGQINPDKIISSFEIDLNNPTTRGWLFVQNQTAYYVSYDGAGIPLGAGGVTPPSGTTVTNYTSKPQITDNTSISQLLDSGATSLGISYDAFVILVAIAISLGAAYYFSSSGMNHQVFIIVFIVGMGVFSLLGWLPTWFVFGEIILVLLIGAGLAARHYGGG